MASTDLTSPGVGSFFHLFLWVYLFDELGEFVDFVT